MASTTSAAAASSSRIQLRSSRKDPGDDAGDGAFTTSLTSDANSTSSDLDAMSASTDGPGGSCASRACSVSFNGAPAGTYGTSSSSSESSVGALLTRRSLSRSFSWSSRSCASCSRTLLARSSSTRAWTAFAAGAASSSSLSTEMSGVGVFGRCCCLGEGPGGGGGFGRGDPRLTTSRATATMSLPRGASTPFLAFTRTISQWFSNLSSVTGSEKASGGGGPLTPLRASTSSTAFRAASRSNATVAPPNARGRPRSSCSMKSDSRSVSFALQ